MASWDLEDSPYTHCILLYHTQIVYEAIWDICNSIRWLWRFLTAKFHVICRSEPEGCTVLLPN
ncbi:hypothetical protein NEOLEDRAFT_275639 [Neolentinus lepideus HHB14362 ss-1]|uniref:Uncharacterized protein n=1 Tax=Neolentinus lepideus HHB14362 ss-1 TaxID=1314782 RepID=A0A165T610_9AGAM|nr:hypothetical protein NEOLEDRAFT_275639 [Neolentinus lepideus HHB14362 ss-1]